MTVTESQSVQIQDFLIGPRQPLAVICGPCVIEDETHTMRCAEHLYSLFAQFPINFIFKASYDKANRTSIHSFRGIGIDAGLKILERVKKEFGVPVTTDVHLPEETAAVAQVCDILQIPAFLCRQTDLLVAAANTGAAINVKKGQFVAPWDMHNVVEKIKACGNQRVILTDRGTSFGYNTLISDMRAIPVMQSLGVPVCFDATHSVQQPGGLGHASGGQREFIPHLSRAAIAAGSNALFIEAHPEPAKAKSDAASVLAFDQLPALMSLLVGIYALVQEQTSATPAVC